MRSRRFQPAVETLNLRLAPSTTMGNIGYIVYTQYGKIDEPILPPDYQPAPSTPIRDPMLAGPEDLAPETLEPCDPMLP